MKAVIYNKKGVPEKLSLREIGKPLPGDNEVLIRVHAVSLNAADYRSMKSLSAKPNRQDLEFLTNLLENGTIRPVIDRRYTLDKTAEAMNYLINGHAAGKVVILVEPRSNDHRMTIE
ncbi:MAG: zinc-binding dehydrogenase [Bacteroidales bacterium]|nr:zinc-binding dehydrogenase [Bacteroidales bacterium]